MQSYPPPPPYLSSIWLALHILPIFIASNNLIIFITGRLIPHSSGTHSLKDIICWKDRRNGWIIFGKGIGLCAKYVSIFLIYRNKPGHCKHFKHFLFNYFIRQACNLLPNDSKIRHAFSLQILPILDRYS